jgi:putative ABC transport system permease protein
VRRRWPAALWRMARREMRRHARRSALIVTLVCLPIAGLTTGMALLRASAVTAEQRATAMMGAAALRADAAGPEVELDTSGLPQPTRIVSFSATEGLLRIGPGDVRSISLTDQSLDDPLTAGMLALTAGRSPRGPGEIAVSAAVLRDLRRQIGDTLQLLRPRRVMRITGTVVEPADVHAWVAATGRRALGSTARRVWLLSPPQSVAGLDVVSTLEQVPGVSITTRERAANAPSAARGAGVLNLIPIVAGFTLMIATLVAAAAFAAGIRREVRELGMLAAVGGNPRQLRAAVLLRGASLGLAGGLAGLALGIVAAMAIHPALDGMVGHVPRPLAFPLVPLFGAAAVAVLAGVTAAVFPARFAARVPPVVALDARVPAGPPPQRVSRFGVLAVIFGCVLTAAGALPRIVDVSTGLSIGLSLTGLAVLLGGFVACSAALVAVIGSLAGRLPLAGRMATRQAARNRSRTGPAVAAITMALAIPILISSALLTARADERARWLPAMDGDQLQITNIGRGGGTPPDAAVRAVLSAIPGSVAAPLDQALMSSGSAGTGGADAPMGPGRKGGVMPVDVTPRAFVTQAETSGGLFVGDEELLAAMGAQSAADELAAGNIVGVGRATVDRGRVALHRADFRDGRAGAVRDHRAQVVPAVQVDGRPLLATIRYAISRTEARRLGMTSEPLGILVRAPDPVSPAELQAARAALAPYPELTIVAGAGARPRSVPTSLLTLLFGVSAAVALAVVAAMVGLTQAEASSERRALFAIGASPSDLRRTTAASAGLLAMIGGVLAVPAGLLPLAAIYAASPAAAPLVVPWTGLAVAAVAVPAVAAAGGAALTRARLGSSGVRMRLS